jgi:hypothetical protein
MRTPTILRVYAGYGSNLCLAQMLRRCPAARPIAAGGLHGHRLVFRGVADVIAAPDHSVPVGLYAITPECEVELDIYEGFPRHYRKADVTVETVAGPVGAFVYVMNSHDFDPPRDAYLSVIEEGYRDWSFDRSPLEAALDHARTHATGHGRVPRRLRHAVA